MFRNSTSFLDYAFLPGVMILSMGGLALFLRWSASPAKRVRGPRPYGLLEPLATYRTLAEAETVAHELRIQGIRASTGVSGARSAVLVWPAQRPLAQVVLLRLGDDAA